jgi:hypothetical protein
MDAARGVATGHDLGFGAVAAICGCVTRYWCAALWNTAHTCALPAPVWLHFARAQGFGDYDPITAEARADETRAGADRA